MKIITVSMALFLSGVACKSSVPSEGANAPPVASTGTTSGATAVVADGGASATPSPPACESATVCDACLAISGCNWTANRCLPTCAMDTSCYGPGNPSAAQCPSADAATPTDASAPAPSSTLVGAHSLAFRADAHPPLGAAGAHGATVWAVTVAASTAPFTELTALFQQATAAHMAASVGELSCAPAVGGAYPSTMPSGDGVQVLTITFRTERDARQFAAAHTDTPLRVGRVRVMCAD